MIPYIIKMNKKEINLSKNYLFLVKEHYILEREKKLM